MSKEKEYPYYDVSVPHTSDMGSYSIRVSTSSIETKEQAALWHYNSARDHDGLEPAYRMPAGTIYKKVE